MPRLLDVEAGTYVCPKCSQAVRRERKDLDTPTMRAMFAGKLPAYLICGRCYSAHPSKPAPLMWRDDVLPKDRQKPLWGLYGSSTSVGSKGKQTAYAYIQDVSYAHCLRFVVYPITERVFTNSGDLLEAASLAVADVIAAKGKKIHAVAVHFSTSKAKAITGQHYAVVDWAPAGIWGEANTVAAGYHKTHQFKIVKQHQTKKGDS